MPLPLAAIGAGAQLAGSAYNMYQGYMQRRAGEKMLKNLVRPTYQTPQEVNDAVNLSRVQSINSRLPGEAEAVNRLGGSTSQAIALAKATGRSPAEIAAIISSSNNNQNDALVDLGIAGSQRQQQDIGNYQQSLNLLGEYKDKEFAYNKWMPYIADRQYAENLIGAGAQNMNSAFGDITSGVATLGTSGVGSGGDDLSSLLNMMRNKNTSPKWDGYKLNSTPPSGSIATGGSGYDVNYGLKLRR